MPPKIESRQNSVLAAAGAVGGRFRAWQLAVERFAEHRWGALRGGVYLSIASGLLLLILAQIILVCLWIPADSSPTPVGRMDVIAMLAAADTLILAVVYGFLMRLAVFPAEALLRKPAGAGDASQAQSDGIPGTNEFDPDEDPELIPPEAIESWLSLPEVPGVRDDAVPAPSAMDLPTLKARYEAAERRLADLRNCMEDALLEIDNATAVQALSASACRLLGVDPTEITGKRFQDVAKLYDVMKDPPHNFPLNDLIPGLLRKDSTMPRIEQVLLETPQGRQFPVALHLHPTVDGAGASDGGIIQLSVVEGASGKKVAALSNAFKDPLTGLLNGTAFARRLDELIETARHLKVAHVLMYGQIDDLDPIQRDFGHAAVEEMLWQVGQAFSATLGLRGDAYHVSQGLFAALLPNSDIQAVLPIAEAVRESVCSRPFRWAESQLYASASLILIKIDSETEGRVAMLDIAAESLRGLVSQGGNRAQIYAPDEARSLLRRSDREWVSWLLPRFERGQLHLVTQSIQPTRADFNDKPWIEIFVRVEEDDGHWLAPGSYLPALERAGLTFKLDLWVIDHAIRAFERTKDSIAQFGNVCINLNGHSLLSENFGDAVFDRLSRNPQLAGNIVFEITEDFASRHTSTVMEFMTALHALRVKFTLDNCHGEEAISLLRRVPADYIKLHDSVTRRVLLDPVDMATVEWITQAAHLIDRKVIAAQVDSLELKNALLGLGIDYMQGTQLAKIQPLIV